MAPVELGETVAGCRAKGGSPRQKALRFRRGLCMTMVSYAQTGAGSTHVEILLFFPSVLYPPDPDH